ncbi:MAG TPA: adenylate/guanylate cyclase domain-containing protein [Solirubrobacterales bacterium]
MRQASVMATSAAEWVEAVKEAERRGELLLAVDLGERGLAECPEDGELAHRSVLALARSGSTEEAARRFTQLRLDGREAEDVGALAARIKKDAALAVRGDARRRLAADAAAAYRRVYELTGGYYPAINAATLELVAGKTGEAETTAREVLGLLEGETDDSYYAVATEAEALLILGDVGGATAALERAASSHGGDHAALATTRRQLGLVCELRGIDPDVLAPLAGPPVFHYCGHRITAPGLGGRFPDEAEGEAAEKLRAEVARHPPGYAYGSLAAGADILWAEGLLERGSELNVVLPVERDEFVRRSVAPSGQGWIDRFDRCLDAARDVTCATENALLEDDTLHRYGAELAMGLALLRSRFLGSEARQLALWDGGRAAGDAGTTIDVEVWRRAGQPVSVVRLDRAGASAAGQTLDRERTRRVVRAMIFADVKGFTKLDDEQLPRFADHVLGAFASSLALYGDAVEHQNSWGDALYVVLNDAATAADCALDLQRAMRSIDLAGAGLPAHLRLRLGAHVGPVFPVDDPVIGGQAFMGSHVSRTARVEPVTPPGTVYVTEQFAAALALSRRDDLRCDYVGHMPTAKGFGRLRMYRLRRSDGRDE